MRVYGCILIATIVVVAGSLAHAFDLQGHRGARGLMPENTLSGFAAALRVGVNTLELDTGISKDGIVVVAHNQSLDPMITRNASGEWLEGEPPTLNSLTLEQIKQYDVGRIDPDSKLAKRFPNQTPVDDETIPTLLEVFQLIRRSGNQVVRLNIETKIDPRFSDRSVDPETFARLVLGEVMAAGFEDRVSIQSFDWRILRVIQNIAPKIETVYLSAQQDWLDTISSDSPTGWTAGLVKSDFGGEVPAMVAAAGGTTWSPFFGDIDRSDIDLAHSLGLKVIPWTVNEPSLMHNLIEFGVDGLITDYPDRARSVLQVHGIELPIPTTTDP